MPNGYDVGLLPDDATFESSLGRWYSVDDAVWPIDRVVSPAPHAGSGVLRATYAGGSPDPAAVPILGSGNSSDYYYVAPGDVISVSAWLQYDPANFYVDYSVIVELQARNATGGSVGTWDSTEDSLSASAWGQSSVTASMPAGAEWVSIQVQGFGPVDHRGILVEGDRFYVSDVAANLRHPLVPPPTQAMAGIAGTRLHRVGGGVQ